MLHFKKMYTVIENYKQFYLKPFFSINTSSIVNNAQSIFQERYERVQKHASTRRQDNIS